MRSVHRLAVLVGFCAGLLAGSEGRAELMRPLSLEELTHAADIVVHGKILTRECAQTPEGRIITRLQLEVTETWKGTQGAKQMTLVHGGGTVGNRRTEVSGQVEYEPGEEVVAFLVLNARHEGVTVGLAQGKFHIWTERATGQKFANNIFHGRNEKGADAKPERPRLALDELERAVKGAAQ